MRNPLCSLLLIMLLAVAGCHSQTSEHEIPFAQDKPAKGVDVVSMRGDLISFTDFATSEISTTAAQIATSTTNPRYRQNALVWRLRMAAALHTISLNPDPRQGLVISWILANKQTLFFKSKFGGDPNDPEVAQMLETAVVVEDRIARIVEKYLPPDTFPKAQQQIATLAKEKPLTSLTGGNRFDQPDLNPAQAPDAVAQVLLLPLAPLTGMQGVTDTATAVNRLNNTVSTLGLLIDDLPLQARWQAQYMVLELQTSDVAKSLSAMFQEATIKAERLTTVAEQANKTLEKLPETLAAEHKFINDTLDAQRNKMFEDIKKERLEATRSLELIVAGLQKQADAIKSDALAAADRIQAQTVAALAAERKKTLDDIDAQRQLIAQDARATIDHIFYRALIFAFVLFLASLILIWFAKRKPKSDPFPPPAHP
jgi:hypothetical protein